MGFARTAVVVIGLLEAVAGDQERYTEVVDYCRPELTAYVERSLEGFDAEAVVTDTFLVAFKKRAEFVGQHDGDYMKWLFAIAQNKSKGIWKSERRARKAYRIGDQATSEPEPEPVVPDHRIGFVPGALDLLSETLRRALVLRSLKGIPVAEILKTEGISRDCWDQRLARAKRELRAILDGVDGK